MRLYQFSGSPNPRRVRVFLAEKGFEPAALEIVEIDIRGGENLSADYRAKNPLGRVPALELDDGTVIAESMAICRYFEALQPEPPLFGEDAISQAQIEMWSRGAEFNLLFPVAMAFRNLSGLFADREKTCTEWGEINVERVQDGLDLLETRLRASDYVGGATYSVADITALCAVDFADRAIKVGIGGNRAHLQRWYDAVSARPSAKA